MTALTVVVLLVLCIAAGLYMLGQVDGYMSGRRRPDHRRRRH